MCLTGFSLRGLSTETKPKRFNEKLLNYTLTTMLFLKSKLIFGSFGFLGIRE